MMKKRGVSPVIATVLLIAIVIVLAIIIFLWARGFITEVITKEVSKERVSADQACGEVSLSVRYIGTELQVTNRGNVPVYRLEIKGRKEGSVEVIKKDVKGEDIGGVSVGDSSIIDVDDYAEIEVVPVILGETKEGSKKAYTCKKNIFKPE